MLLLNRGCALERVTGIEPAFSAWEADVLPLNYTRRSVYVTAPADGRRSRERSGPAGRTTFSA